MVQLNMAVERNGLEFKSGVIRSMSQPETYIPFNFDVITNNIEAKHPPAISKEELTFLGKVIQRQIGGWKEIKKYSYT